MTEKFGSRRSLALVYVSFLLSGAAGLMYQVIWFRSLSLIFGGSHLAVATVLCVFMSGLALGSYFFGKYLKKAGKLLRLYGFLELGIAFFAAIFMALLRIYPTLYAAIAQHFDNSPFHLSLIRILFSFIALIVPTTLMGGTLPVLTSFAAGHPGQLGKHLSYLYGINTIGAVLGTAASGFLLLPVFGLTVSSFIAIGINILVGFIGIGLQSKYTAAPEVDAEGDTERMPDDKEEARLKPANDFPFRLILFGIAVSGFCALGYEILWTRVLILLLAATHYSFTVMLTAFLMGIGLGGAAYGIFLKMRPSAEKETARALARSIALFGIVEVLIGAITVVIMFLIFKLPAYSVFLQNVLGQFGLDAFSVRQWSNFALAFSFLLGPSFFMGFAFPLAGRIRTYYKNTVGPAVGEMMSYNTIGAILGAAISGYALIYLFGIEKSLRLLAAINIGTGLFIITSSRNGKYLNYATAAFLIVMIGAVPFSDRLKLWDPDFFAIYRSNSPAAFSTEGLVRERLRNINIEYYAEGAESIVSAISYKSSGLKTFSTNGRVEASTGLQDLQNQYFLGHLPMLLHKEPRKVLIVGAGSGMTLGATSVYPEVETITLVELEPKVLGVVKAFSDYNHNVLNNRKLNIVYNDGRNFLLTTKEKFDIVSSDPIHPWFRGAGSLYTEEYFKLVADRLNENGIMSQWLPIYQLTPQNLRSIVKTFSEEFKYVMIWLTTSDAEMIGSNSPLILDAASLKKKMSFPEVAHDFDRIMIRSVNDLLKYFVMGNEGVKAYSGDGIINTDDSMYLELSAPYSIGNVSVEWENVRNLAANRESVVRYLTNIAYKENDTIIKLFDEAHQIYLSGNLNSPEFQAIAQKLNDSYSEYGPWRALRSLIPLK